MKMLLSTHSSFFIFTRPKGTKNVNTKDKNKKNIAIKQHILKQKLDNLPLRGVYLERMEERYRGVVPFNHNNIF